MTLTPAAMASAARVKLTGRSRERDLACVGRIKTGNELDQRAFACAIRSEQSMDFTGSDVEIHSVQRHNAGKVFRSREPKAPCSKSFPTRLGVTVTLLNENKFFSGVRQVDRRTLPRNLVVSRGRR